MRNTVILLSVLTSLSLYSQDSKAGINTTVPKETLEINGTLKISGIPKSGEGKIYNGDTSRNTTFNGTKSMVIDNNGNVGYVDIKPEQKNARTLELNNSSNANQDLTGMDYDGFLFDGNSNINVILPKAIDGKSIFFYAWGGGGGSATNRTYTFTGGESPLQRPSASVTNFSTGVSWSGTVGQNSTLTLTQPQNSTGFRYSKIEFIAIGTQWFYVH